MIPIHLTTLTRVEISCRGHFAKAVAIYLNERCRPVLATPTWFTMQFVTNGLEKPKFLPGRAYPAWQIPLADSQRWRHRWAYQQRQDADFYVLMDDDIQPFPRSTDGRMWWDFCRDTFRQHQQLAMLQPFLFNEHTHPVGCPELIPENAIGGLRVLRAEAVDDMLQRLGDWPAMNPEKNGAYDATITEALAGERWECATVSGWWATHVGRNLSTIKPDGLVAKVTGPLVMPD